jgi:hypothetical protein
MRFICMTLITAVILSCNSKKEAAKTVSPHTDTVTKQLQQAEKSSPAVLAEYETYLKSLDKEQPNHVKAAILNYEWLFKTSNAAICDSGYALFNEFYEEVGRYMQNHQSPEDIPAKRKKEMLKQLKQYGFTTEPAEGTFIYTNDRDSVNPKFYPFVSATMKQFMQQQHLETNKGRSGGEGSMAISPEIFAERYVFWQRFMQQHPDFLLKHWVFAYSRSYAEELVFGMENTPLQNEGSITETYNTIYRQLFDKYSNEPFVACYKPYYEALKKNDAAFIESFKEKFRSVSNEKTFPDAE